MQRLVCFLCVLTLFAPMLAGAQQHIETPRGDGAKTPLIVFEAEGAKAACAPLALLSHGAGANAERNLPYLANALSRDGWRAIAIGHNESGMSPLRNDMQASGWRQGLIDLITDTSAYKARFMDIDAAMKWSEAQCRAPYKVLIGHSMGAITVMLVAGARNKLDLDKSGIRSNSVFDAYVALSPEGPGMVFPDDAWRTIKAPMLVVTGTHDAGLGGDYTWRTRAFDGLGPGCRSLAVIDGATHMNLGGLDPHGSVTTKTAKLVVSYLDGGRGRRCAKLIAEPGVVLRSK